MPQNYVYLLFTVKTYRMNLPNPKLKVILASDNGDVVTNLESIKPVPAFYNAYLNRLAKTTKKIDTFIIKCDGYNKVDMQAIVKYSKNKMSTYEMERIMGDKKLRALGLAEKIDY